MLLLRGERISLVWLIMSKALEKSIKSRHYNLILCYKFYKDKKVSWQLISHSWDTYETKFIVWVIHFSRLHRTFPITDTFFCSGAVDVVLDSLDDIQCLVDCPGKDKHAMQLLLEDLTLHNLLDVSEPPWHAGLTYIIAISTTYTIPCWMTTWTTKKIVKHNLRNYMAPLNRNRFKGCSSEAQLIQLHV